MDAEVLNALVAEIGARIREREAEAKAVKDRPDPTCYVITLSRIDELCDVLHMIKRLKKKATPRERGGETDGVLR